MICIKCHNSAPDGQFCSLCGARQDRPPRKARARGNGTGTVFRRGRTWTAQSTYYTHIRGDDGIIRKVRKYRTKGGFETKKAAMLYLESLRNGAIRKAPTLQELWLVWEQSSLDKYSTGKRSAFRRAHEKIKSIADQPISELTTMDLQRTVNDVTETYYTARDIKVLLSHLYKMAVADSAVSTNLALNIVLPKLGESEPVPFAADEVDRMWTAYADGNVFVGYLLLMIYSGMMPGEMFDCRKDQIDFDRCEIFGCGKKTQTRKEVAIVFADCVKPVIETLVTESKSEMLVDIERSKWYKMYHSVLSDLGIRDLPPYSCRHTTGTEAARQNLSAPIVQKIMRHAKISTTQRYIHLGADDVKTGINLLPKRNVS